MRSIVKQAVIEYSYLCLIVSRGEVVVHSEGMVSFLCGTGIEPNCEKYCQAGGDRV